MIRGTVDPFRQAVVRLVVRGPQPGAELSVNVVVDTGYDGPLTLPPRAVAALGLPLRRVRRVQVADGSLIEVPVHEARVVWDDVERTVMVRALGSQPLLGMELLAGHRLCVDAVDGGSVTIEAL